MKRKEAIKKLRNGEIQIYNNLLPSTKKIKKLLKEAFPIDTDIVDNDEVYFSNCENNPKIWLGQSVPYERLKTVKLSSISKGKNKLKQLDKSFSELVKDVAELKSKNENFFMSEEFSKYGGSKIPSEHTKSLDVDFENVETKLEIGKWYKVKRHLREEQDALVVFNGYGKEAYGFHHGGEYTDSYGDEHTFVRKEYTYTLATPSEVEQALISEAKKRGIENAKSINTNTIYNHGGIRSFDKIEKYFFEKDNTLHIQTNKGIYTLFSKGNWAEIIKEETPIKEEEVIDWDKPQLLKSKNNENTVYFYDGENKENFNVYAVSGLLFEKGQVIKYPNQQKILFKPFKGTLTINQE